jgi:hypothetical protein
LRIWLAITAEPARGVHALLECHKPAIRAAAAAAVVRTPRIVLGFGACSNADDTDANAQLRIVRSRRFDRVTVNCRFVPPHRLHWVPRGVFCSDVVGFPHWIVVIAVAFLGVRKRPFSKPIHEYAAPLPVNGGSGIIGGTNDISSQAGALPSLFNHRRTADFSHTASKIKPQTTANTFVRTEVCATNAPRIAAKAAHFRRLVIANRRT